VEVGVEEMVSDGVNLSTGFSETVVVCTDVGYIIHEEQPREEKAPG